MRLIDADALEYTFCDNRDGSIVTDKTIDATPTVCCEECTKWTDQRSPWNADLRLCADFPAYMSASAGCSFFERRSHD